MLSPTSSSTPSRPEALRPVPSGAPCAVALFNDPGDAADVLSLATSDGLRTLLKGAGAVIRHAAFRGEWRHLARPSVASAIRAALADDALRQVLADVDAVVVEGSDDVTREIQSLAILGAAQQLGLPTLLVNAVCEPIGLEAAATVLGRLTDCLVSDRATAVALQWIGVPHRVVGDLAAAAAFVGAARQQFTNGVVFVGNDLPESLTPVEWAHITGIYAINGQTRGRTWPQAVAELRTAAVLVTDHVDGVRLARLAGVPVVPVTPETALALADAPLDIRDIAVPLAERLATAIVAGHRPPAASGAPQQIFGRLVPGLAPPPDADAALAAACPHAAEAVRLSTAPGGSVLHVGAGPGRLVAALATSGYHAWGTDVAWRLAAPERLRYSPGRPGRLPFADHVFDTVVVAADWVDHLDGAELASAIAEIARVGRDHIVLEISGRPARQDQASGPSRGMGWWTQYLHDHGLSRRGTVLPADAETMEPGVGYLVTRLAPLGRTVTTRPIVDRHERAAVAAVPGALLQTPPVRGGRRRNVRGA